MKYIAIGLNVVAAACSAFSAIAAQEPWCALLWCCAGFAQIGTAILLAVDY